VHQKLLYLVLVDDVGLHVLLCLSRGHEFF
jgi:hypothetical protein